MTLSEQLQKRQEEAEQLLPEHLKRVAGVRDELAKKGLLREPQPLIVPLANPVPSDILVRFSHSLTYKF